jgi:hypothetical protein
VDSKAEVATACTYGSSGWMTADCKDNVGAEFLGWVSNWVVGWNERDSGADAP